MDNHTDRQDNQHNKPRPDKSNRSKPGRNKPGRNKKGLFVIFAFVLGMILLSRHDPVVTIDCTADIIASKPDVIMLGAWWCSYCYQTKRYFQQNNIHYCEYDMESTHKGKQLYQQSGSGPIPVLLIGEYQLKGFNEQQIEAALATLK